MYFMIIFYHHLNFHYVCLHHLQKQILLNLWLKWNDYDVIMKHGLELSFLNVVGTGIDSMHFLMLVTLPWLNSLISNLYDIVYLDNLLKIKNVSKYLENFESGWFMITPVL